VITYFLKQLVGRVAENEVVDFFCQRYYSQYIDLREFYSKVSAISAVASVVPIPMLPADPPQFGMPDGIELETSLLRMRQCPNRKHTTQVIDLPLSQDNLLASDQRQPALVSAPISIAMPASTTTPKDQESASPRSISSSPNSPWPTFSPDVTTPTFNPSLGTSPPAKQEKPQKTVSQAAASNSFFLQLMGIKPESTSSANPAPQAQKNQSAAHSPIKNPEPAPIAKPNTEDYMSYRRVEAPVSQSGTNAKSTDNELEKMKRELAMVQNKLSQIEERNRILLETNGKLVTENNSLKLKIEHLIEDHEEERRQRILKELKEAYNLVDSSLFALDSPANVGNRDATAQILLASSKKLMGEISGLFEAVKSGEESAIRAAVYRVIASNKEFMENAKGCTCLTQNQDLQQALLKSARGTGSCVVQLLHGLVQSVNILEDWTSTEALQKHRDALSDKMQQVEAVVEGLIKERLDAQPTEQKEDLEALAQQELMKAAKIIEEAAKQLSSVKAERKPPSLPPGKIDLSGPIIDAAQSIAEAAQHLIAAANQAQKERVEKGKLPNSAQSYKIDPAWSEGLISAAKFVALATGQLVAAASKLVDGELKEADLIAASKAVAAATAQLVAASTAKADHLSKLQENLMKASGLVKRATDQLVDAARKASAQIQQEDLAQMDFSRLSHAEYKVKQVDQMAKIIELEKEIGKQREVLARMRKAEYSIVNPYVTK